MYKKILGSAIGIGLLAAGVFFAWNYFHTTTNEYLPTDHVVTIGGKTIQVRIADTEAVQVQGLSGFKTLPADQGMFFIFNKLDYYAFWMKDMRFPLDIVWMKQVNDNNYTVVNVMQNVSPDTYPQAFTSPEPVDGFLELPAYTVDASIVGNELVLNKK
ncbi:MAG: DUF192 domain-containing protein [bacterium]